MDNPGIFDAQDVKTEDGYLIIHTAAVTGRSKGALLSHGNVMRSNMHFAYFLNIQSEDVHLNILPLYHIGGLFVVTAAFHMGALNVNMSKFDAERAVSLIEEKKVSDQKEKVKQAEKALEEAKEALRLKRLEVDKLHTHKKSWEKEKKRELEILEERAMDELGTVIHEMNQRKKKYLD